MNKRSMTEFKIKKGTAARGLTIEGFANKATEDRIGDLIPGKAWELDNFKKNPIIFFNHDRNLPIGKAVSVEAGDDGLKMKVRLSKSKEAPIPFIRDMIKEGIVKSFSVGFDDHGTFQKDADTGLNMPERAELLETSVVTIPMHQDSTFDMSKALTKKMGSWKTKSYHEAKLDVLKVKGAWVSAYIQDALEKLAEDVNFDKDDALQELAMNSSITLQQLMDVVTGNAKDLSDEMMGILAESFSLDLDKLKELNERQSLEKEEDEEEEEKASDGEEEEEEEEKASDGDEEEEEEEEEEKGHSAKFEKGSHQEAIAEVLPSFIDKGLSADESVTAAIKLIEAEMGNQSYSAEDYTAFFKLADCKKEEGDASNMVGLDASKENEVNFPNPLLDLQKAQLSMQGSAVTLLREIKAELRMLNTKADGNSEAEGEEVSVAEVEEAEESKALDRRSKMLEAFTKRLDKLGSF